MAHVPLYERGIPWWGARCDGPCLVRGVSTAEDGFQREGRPGGHGTGCASLPACWLPRVLERSRNTAVDFARFYCASVPLSCPNHARYRIFSQDPHRSAITKSNLTAFRQAPSTKTHVEAHKNPIYRLPNEERQRWQEAVKGLDAKWAAELDAKGLPGQAMLQEARALAAKYGEAE